MTVETLHHKDTPTISIAMPVFNAGKYLNDAVKSIINQTFKDWELILIDDGSTDNSVEVIREIKDDRIIILQDGKNEGLAKRLNQAIDIARGDYFARMDGDDIAVECRLEKQIKFLKDNPGIDLLSTRAYKINEENDIVGELPFDQTHRKLTRYIWRSIYMPHPTWLGKTEWFRRFKYKLPASYLSEDQELLLRASKTSKYACLDEFLLLYRVKTNIDFKRQLLTYYSILKFQTTYFIKTEQYLLPLVLASFTVRCIKTIRALVLQSVK
ncbi:glycosyltransferase family 2 protein [Methylophilus glucosoxydans]|uniref:Glycosyltransferase family 2 protein n=1 Tax=Methylophilus glucosoxydans TaxID=752553 RepID=A0ABW3GIM8_9PROT